jgi:hypothetical protein
MTGVEARTMSNTSSDEFGVLLDALEEARQVHRDWCEEFVNSDSCPGREEAWARVQALRALVDAQIEAEERRER